MSNEGRTREEYRAEMMSMLARMDDWQLDLVEEAITKIQHAHTQEELDAVVRYYEDMAKENARAKAGCVG